jgi:hypothetical protein
MVDRVDKSRRAADRPPARADGWRWATFSCGSEQSIKGLADGVTSFSRAGMAVSEGAESWHPLPSTLVLPFTGDSPHCSPPARQIGRGLHDHVRYGR